MTSATSGRPGLPVPVVVSGRVVGTVNRRDPAGSAPRDDSEIAAEVAAGLSGYAGDAAVRVASVTTGVVVLTGLGDAPAQRVATQIARTVSGVVRVEIGPDGAAAGLPAIDHSGLRVLAGAECLQRLAAVPVGRLGFVSDGKVTIVPVNHAVDAKTIVFRTADGSKLAAAERVDLVAFEADAFDDRRRMGWSVLIRGRMEAVRDAAEAAGLDALGLSPWPQGVSRPVWLRLYPEEVSGREIVRAGPS